MPAGLDAEGIAAAERARIARFRNETRDRRIAVAWQAEARYDRPISWGATAGATTEHFTTVRAPVLTRLEEALKNVETTAADAPGTSS